MMSQYLIPIGVLLIVFALTWYTVKHPSDRNKP